MCREEQPNSLINLWYSIYSFQLHTLASPYATTIHPTILAPEGISKYHDPNSASILHTNATTIHVRFHCVAFALSILAIALGRIRNALTSNTPIIFMAHQISTHRPTRYRSEKRFTHMFLLIARLWFSESAYRLFAKSR